MIIRVFAAVLAISASGFCAMAQAGEPAAVLAKIQGKVLVNQGDGYVPGFAGLALLPNAKLMVGAESAALVSYNSCVVALDGLSMHVVSQSPPCLHGQKTATVDSLFIEPTSITCSSSGAADDAGTCEMAGSAKKGKDLDLENFSIGNTLGLAVGTTPLAVEKARLAKNGQAPELGTSSQIRHVDIADFDFDRVVANVDIVEDGPVSAP